MSCPHSVLECVEFAEGDSFFYSPDANHHIECFDIVGSVVLRVVYLFHIPYQIYWCKDSKNPPHFTMGRDGIKNTIFHVGRNTCKYSGYEWKNKAPARNVEQRVHIIWAVAII